MKATRTITMTLASILLSSGLAFAESKAPAGTCHEKTITGPLVKGVVTKEECQKKGEEFVWVDHVQHKTTGVKTAAKSPHK